jgi:hypothetical protein
LPNPFSLPDDDIALTAQPEDAQPADSTATPITFESGNSDPAAKPGDVQFDNERALGNRVAPPSPLPGIAASPSLPTPPSQPVTADEAARRRYDALRVLIRAHRDIDALTGGSRLATDKELSHAPRTAAEALGIRLPIAAPLGLPGTLSGAPRPGTELPAGPFRAGSLDLDSADQAHPDQMPDTTAQSDFLAERAPHGLIDGLGGHWNPEGTQFALAENPPAQKNPVPQISRRTADEWVLAAAIKPADIGRLSGRDVIATPQIKALVAANIDKVRVRSGNEEKFCFGYLMPDGSIEIRPAGVARSTRHADTIHASPSGPGIPIFGMHGHIEKRRDGSDGDEGMVDELFDSQGYGDTQSLMTERGSIPMATIYGGKIGWHEMIGGQLIFTMPRDAQTSAQRSALQDHLNKAQKKFLK